MNFVEFSIKKPVTVLVGVILVVMFGIIGLYSMPYQLSPTVTEPEITVRTTWTGATPYEIEREVIEEQEKVLKGIPGLVTMESASHSSLGEITLRFRIGTDTDEALLRVSNKLNEVPDYPENVERPIISATGAAASPVIWMILKTLPENKTPIDTYRTYFEEEVRQYLERVPGVADLFVFGGTESEMHVVVDPDKLAAHRLTVDDLINVLGSENANVSAGNMDVGRREFRIRSVGEFQSPADIERVVVTSDGLRRITVADVATVRFGYAKREGAMLFNGEPGIVCGIQCEPGYNVLQLTDDAEAVVKELNQGQLKENGLFLDWAYDQRPYINGAIDLVKRNILIGGCLAIIVLLVFLRSISSTVVVGVAIPISVVGCFILLNATGRTLNVVSLAGISFAVGMLVDNAIVVLENIDRHRKQLGKSPFQAALDGTNEVWGAVVASTLTTVAVFLPVVFIEEEAGQLFKDIAIAVTCAILLSLFVSVSVIPMFSNQLFSLGRKLKNRQAGDKAGPGRQRRGLGGALISFFMLFVGLSVRNWFTRLLTIGTLTTAAVVLSISFFPKMEYLPQGNRNLLLNIFIPPPGLSFQERWDIGKHVWHESEPHYRKDVDGLPGIESLFYVGHPQIMLFGAISTHEQRAGELIPFFTRMINSIPGMYGVSLQAGIFQDRLGRGRTIELDLSHGDMNRLVAGAGAAFGAVRQAIQGSQVRPVPSLELTFPEIELAPDRERIKAAGMSAKEVGVALDVLMDGRKVGEFKKVGSKTIDMVLKASEHEITTPEELYSSLVATPGGRSVPVSSLAVLRHTSGITQIRHLERQRTITLQITPPTDVPLEAAMDTISQQVVPGLQQAGPLADIKVNMSGAADKLTQTRKAMQWNFLLAVAITYLLMSALFGNFIYPFIILFTVPLAAAGGFLGLKLENWFIAPQPMDILTMLGFVILIGVVVNNAILIVHQSLNNIRQGGMEHKEAILESVRTRLRPIFMSATTSIFGMLPLAVAPGTRLRALPGPWGRDPGRPGHVHHLHRVRDPGHAHVLHPHGKDRVLVPGFLAQPSGEPRAGPRAGPFPTYPGHFFQGRHKDSRGGADMYQ